jgi:hypothetical protein
MNLEQLIEAIYLMVKQRSNIVKLHADPIMIKMTPHSWPVKIYGVQNILNTVWYQDGTGEWKQFDLRDPLTQHIITSIHGRLKLMQAVA